MYMVCMYCITLLQPLHIYIVLYIILYDMSQASADREASSSAHTTTTTHTTNTTHHIHTTTTTTNNNNDNTTATTTTNNNNTTTTTANNNNSNNDNGYALAGTARSDSKRNSTETLQESAPDPTIL